MTTTWSLIRSQSTTEIRCNCNTRPLTPTDGHFSMKTCKARKTWLWQVPRQEDISNQTHRASHLMVALQNLPTCMSVNLLRVWQIAMRMTRKTQMTATKMRTTMKDISMSTPCSEKIKIETLVIQRHPNKLPAVFLSVSPKVTQIDIREAHSLFLSSGIDAIPRYSINCLEQREQAKSIPFLCNTRE